MEETIERRNARLQDAWATRPARPREGRMLAGVSVALARRYRIDPVLVRVAFAVAALYGPGIPLYLLGCAVLPDAGRSGRGRAGTVLSVLLGGAAVLLALLLFAGDGGWVVPLAICAGLLGLLHVWRGGAGRDEVAGHAGTRVTTTPGSPPDAVPGGGGASDATGGDSPTTGSTASVPDSAPASVPEPTGGHGPPAWDPLGAAPFAWDLPDPGPERTAPAPPPSRLTPVTLALALLAGGAVGAVGLAVPGAVGAATAPAVALAVVGVGLVIGAFRRVGRWLLPFAVVLACATWLAGALPWADLRGGVGTIADAPRSVALVAPEYSRGVGDVSLDLSGLDLRGRPGTPEPVARTSARVGVGSIVVTVPLDADLVVRGTSGLGDVSVAGQSRGGSSAVLDVVDPGPDGPGGGRIELDLEAGMGSVSVDRG